MLPIMIAIHFEYRMYILRKFSQATFYYVSVRVIIAFLFILSGILSNYLATQRKSMYNYQISCSGVCNTFFQQPENAFACTSQQHFGHDRNIFMEFNKYWKHVRNTTKHRE